MGGEVALHGYMCLYMCMISLLLFSHKLCLTLCNLMDCSTPGFPVLHCLPEVPQIHVHCVTDAVQPSHLLLAPSPAVNHILYANYELMKIIIPIVGIYVHKTYQMIESMG